MGSLGARWQAHPGMAALRRTSARRGAQRPSGDARHLFTRKDARSLRRSFKAIEGEVRAEVQAAMLESLTELAERRERVLLVTSAPPRPHLERVQATLACEHGSSLVLRDVPVHQLSAVAEACHDGELRVVGAGRPGALFVLSLESAHGRCQLVGSHVTVDPPRPTP